MERVQDLSLKIFYPGLFLLDLVAGVTLAGQPIEKSEEDAGDDEITQGRESEDPGDEMEYAVHIVGVDNVPIKVYRREWGKISKR